MSAEDKNIAALVAAARGALAHAHAPYSRFAVGAAVRLTDGRVLEQHIDAMLASPSRPLSAQACTTKFDRCWQLAAQPMHASAPLKDAVADLENCNDVKDLVSLLLAA